MADCYSTGDADQRSFEDVTNRYRSFLDAGLFKRLDLVTSTFAIVAKSPARHDIETAIIPSQYRVLGHTDVALYVDVDLLDRLDDEGIQDVIDKGLAPLRIVCAPDGRQACDAAGRPVVKMVTTK